MDQTIPSSLPASDRLAIELAELAVQAIADYDLLIRNFAGHSDWDTRTQAAIDQSLEELDAACVALAAVPTTTLAGQQAKARVLLVTARTSSVCGAEIGDDTGLVLSLLEDIVGKTTLTCGTTVIEDLLSNGGHGFGSRVH